MRLVCTMSVLLSCMSCGDVGLVPLVEVDPDKAPYLELSPRRLNFGLSSIGQPESRTFTVTNVGFTTLSVSELVLEGQEGAYTLVPELPLPAKLEELEEMDVEVIFDPSSSGNFDTKLAVRSNDPLAPEKMVTLKADARETALTLSPAPMEFGSQFVPCAYGQAFRLENEGREPIEITALTLTSDSDAPVAELEIVDGPNFYYVTEDDLPFTLQPAEERYFAVKYQPYINEPISAEFTVEAGDQSVSAEISGEGSYAVSISDEYEVPAEEPAVSILIAVDQSGSMDAEAAILASEFSSFISTLEGGTDNWKIGVVTQTNGCFNSGILTTNTSNLSSVFSSAVTLGSGTESEKLLQFTNTALSQTAGSQCNQGFFTGDGPLHLVMVSDEDDQSSTGWSTYHTNWLGYVGYDPSRLVLHAIADINGSCGQGAAKYEAFANYTGGLVLDICSSTWGAQVSTIAQAAIDSLGYSLSDAFPYEPSIEVRLDGEVLESGWTYDPIYNNVILDEPGPAGAELEISYTNLSLDCADPVWPSFQD